MNHPEEITPEYAERLVALLGMMSDLGRDALGFLVGHMASRNIDLAIEAYGALLATELPGKSRDGRAKEHARLGLAHVADSGIRQYGKVFDEVAVEYDRRRPAYPDELVDQACQVAGIGSGAHVLEVGSGSGQLTRALVARGLHVTALEPGTNLMALARQNLEGAGEVEFVNASFEEALLPRQRFQAMFSASAFHWIDPKIGWQKAADVLVPGGTLALVQYCGLEEPRTKPDQDAVLAALRNVVPDVAETWPVYRDLDATLAGIQQRRGNVSEVWAWLGSYDVAEDYAGPLFGDVQVALMPKLAEHTADQLNAILRTLSFYARISPGQRQALEREYEAIYERLGRPIRSSTVAALVTARRSTQGRFVGMGKLNLYYGTVKSTTGGRHIMAWANSREHALDLVEAALTAAEPVLGSVVGPLMSLPDDVMKPGVFVETKPAPEA